MSMSTSHAYHCSCCAVRSASLELYAELQYEAASDFLCSIKGRELTTTGTDTATTGSGRQCGNSASGDALSATTGSTRYVSFVVRHTLSSW
jgi:hypothetical protein